MIEVLTSDSNPYVKNLEYFSSSFDEGYIRSDEFRCRGDAIKL